MGDRWKKTMGFASKSKDYCGLWCRMQVPRFITAFTRMIIWGGAITVAFWPSVVLSKATWNIWAPSMGVEVNNGGHFKDFFFVSIVVCIIGISNIFDNAATSWRNGPKWGVLSYVVFVLLAIFFFGELFLYLLPHFIEIASQSKPLSPSIVNHDNDIIRNVLFAGLATELIIAMRERPHYVPASGSAVGNQSQPQGAPAPAKTE